MYKNKIFPLLFLLSLMLFTINTVYAQSSLQNHISRKWGKKAQSIISSPPQKSHSSNFNIYRGDFDPFHRDFDPFYDDFESRFPRTIHHHHHNYNRDPNYYLLKQKLISDNYVVVPKSYLKKIDEVYNRKYETPSPTPTPKKRIQKKKQQKRKKITTKKANRKINSKTIMLKKAVFVRRGPSNDHSVSRILPKGCKICLNEDKLVKTVLANRDSSDYANEVWLELITPHGWIPYKDYIHNYLR